MRNKRHALDLARPTAAGGSLRNRIRADLERLGLAEALSDSLARKLEPTVAKLSEEESAAVLGSVAEAHGGAREAGDRGRISAQEIADVQRLMQGFKEEVQKLDEGLRVLGAYVSRLRERGSAPQDQTLH